MYFENWQLFETLLNESLDAKLCNVPYISAAWKGRRATRSSSSTVRGQCGVLKKNPSCSHGGETIFLASWPFNWYLMRYFYAPAMKWLQAFFFATVVILSIRDTTGTTVEASVSFGHKMTFLVSELVYMVFIFRGLCLLFSTSFKPWLKHCETKYNMCSKLHLKQTPWDFKNVFTISEACCKGTH